MHLSQLFIPILKENPAEAKIKSHQLMLRVGMIKQSSSGIYSWLPLGLKIMKKIENIVREEQNNIGAQELLMPTIQSADIWKESGRYEDYGKEMLRIKVEHFAFPFGNIGSIDKKALDLARIRYKYIYSGVRGRNGYGTNPSAIRRESLDPGDSYQYNRFVASGGLSFYYWRARRRLDEMVS